MNLWNTCDLDLDLDLTLRDEDGKALVTAAWALLLARYSNINDVTWDMRLDDLPTQTLKLQIKRSLSLSNFLHEVWGGIQQRHYPAGQPKWSPSSCIAFGVHYTDHVSNKMPFIFHDSQYSLALIFRYWPPRPTGEVVRLCSRQSIYTTVQTRRILHQFRHTLSQLMELPGLTLIRDLQLISPQDKEEIAKWNSVSPILEHSCLHALIDAQAILRPDALALSSSEGSITYASLKRLSDLLCEDLQSSGLKPGDCVPICCPKSVMTKIAMLSVLKAGACCVVLDVNHPDQHLRTVIETLHPSFILHSSDQELRFRGLKVRKNVLSLDLLQAKESNGRTGRQNHFDASPECTAFVVFTSGSTGTPKGILLSHQAIASSAVAQAPAMNISCKTRALQFSSYAFDISIYEIFITLMQGGSVFIPSETERLTDLAGFINSNGVTWAILTPSLVSILTPELVPGLQTLNLTGECPNQANVDTWAHRVCLVNAYGSAEASTCSPTVLSCTSPPNFIGTPIGARGWITDPDDHNKLAPIGAVGELIVEGHMVASGYLDNEAGTRAAFIDPPSWMQGMEKDPTKTPRFFKMGDLVQYGWNGSMFYHGRKDTQIRLHGQRVDVMDVEFRIKTLAPDIQNVAVDTISLANSKSSTVLVAFFVYNNCLGEYGGEPHTIPLSAEKKDQLRQLRRSLERLLPSYMVPSAFIAVNCFPILLTSKVDRTCLKRLGMQLTSKQFAEYALQDDVENDHDTSNSSPALSIVRELWSTTLGLPAGKIKKQDNFFHFGGTSIKAIQLMSLAQKQGYRLDYQSIFRRPTANQMAQALESAAAEPILKDDIYEPLSILQTDDLRWRESLMGEIAEQAVLPMSSRVVDAFPCTPFQEGILSLSAKQPGTFFAQNVMRLGCNIDVNRFKVAWTAVVANADALRARFVHSKSQGMLQIVVDEPVEWVHAPELEKYLEEDKKRHFILGGPTSRFALSAGINMEQYFIWTVHHAVYDAWTLSLLLDEASRIYNGQSPSAFPPFAQLVRHILLNDQMPSERYWKAKLSNLDTRAFPESFSTDYEVANERQMHHRMSIESRSCSDTTLATRIQAAWAFLLATYTRSDDVVFGQNLSGRNYAISDIDRMVGLVATTVPVRMKIDRSWSVAQLLNNMQTEMTELAYHQHYGLQNIARLNEDGKRACQFRNLLIIDPPETDLEKDPSDQVLLRTAYEGEISSRAYPLHIRCTPSSNSILIETRYDGDIISESQCQRLLWQLEHIIRQLQDTEALVGSIEAASPADKEQIRQWHCIEPLMSANHCVQDFIAGQASSHPSRKAIDGWDRKFSYGELESISERLARYLFRLGSSGAMIPLCFTKSAWTVIALLGVLKSGAAFVPLDPSHPTDRLIEICSQARGKIILVSPSEAQRFTGFVDHVISLDEDFTAQIPCERASTLPKVDSEAAAYVIFTSGTTGKPKGVVVPHRSLSSSVGWQGKMMKVTSMTRALQFASYAFDAMIIETVLILVYGGCVCVPSPLERLQVADVISRMDINWAALNPSVARTVDPAVVPSLETLVVGGEPLGHDLIDIWASKVSLINMYGPTECCVFCSGTQVDPSVPDPSNIGRCMNSKGWIVTPDDHDRLTPIGAIGELVLEGPIVGRGYLGDKEKTDAVFINHPGWLGSPSPAKVYKTGDLVSFRADGTLSIVGRKDTQVKVRGNRVELGDIEHHIKQFFLPKKSFVVLDLIEESSQRKNLVAFYSTSNEIDTSGSLEGLVIAQSTVDSLLERLVAYLRNNLPEYMIPAFWIGLHRVPLTTSGKVDRRVLLALASAAVEQQYAGQKRAITKSTEQTVAAIWGKALSISTSKIGPNDNLFSIGGDSITAMKVSAMLLQLGFSISVKDIFQNATLPELAALLETPHKLKGVDRPNTAFIEPEQLTKLRVEAVEIYKIPPNKILDIYPCTPLQNALLVLSMQETGSYVCQLNFTLPGNIDITRFQASWDAVIAHHDILRTTYIPSTKGDFHQIILDSKIEWTNNPEMQVADFLARDTERAMRPGTPMVRLSMVANQFVLSIHHASYDGWTLPRILHDVERVYAGSSPGPTISIKSFVEHIMRQSQAHAAEFWRDQLSGSHHIKFPRLPSQAYRPRADGVLERHVQFERRSGSAITSATIIRAAWALLVARYSVSKEIVFGVTTNGRGVSLPDIENIMGPTIATMPVRVTVQRDQKITELLRKVQDQAAQMTNFEHFGMHNIRKVCPEAKEASEFQNILAINTSLDKHSSTILDPKNLAGEQTNFHTIALTIECTVSQNGVTSKAYFDSRTIEPEQVSRALGQFGCALIQLSEENPNTTLQDIGLTSDDDIRDIFYWNRVPLAPIRENCVHDQFEERANLQPESSAVCAWDGEFSYQALNTISTQIAKAISNRVSPGKPVPVCFEKSAWAIIAMLAVLKAGGAYVPLDPASPKSRLRTIIRDLNCGLFLCSETQHQHLSDLGTSVVAIGPSSEAARVCDANDAVVLPEVTPHSPAFILFTSGSTGKPKGVVIEHRGFCYGARHHGSAFHIDHRSRVFQFAAHVFDVSFSDIFTTLIRGGCVCVPSDYDRVNDLAGAITKANANYAFLTPTVANTLKPEDVPSLKTLVIGGEAPTQNVLRRWVDYVNLVVVWGPAECTVYSTGHEHTRANDDPADIGSPIGAHVWLTEPDNPNRLAPIGTVGEILVEGPIVAKGYFNDPEKTGESFLVNPDWTKLQNSDGALRRFYRTADMGRYLSDGTIQFIGRQDNQVKVRGQRVELSEIEHQAREHKLVEHCLAFYPQHGPFKNQLTAIFTLVHEKKPDNLTGSFEVLPQKSTKATIISIKKHLVARVPPYMVPVAFVGVQSIPLMPSGKLNRTKVKDWLVTLDEDLAARLRASPGECDIEPPQSPIEENLRLIWSRCLGRDADEVGRNSPFLSLGGDSISAMQVVSKCREQGLGLSVRDILQAKTISNLATRAIDISSALKMIDSIDSDKHPIRLSHMQSLFFRAARRLGPCRFNQSFLLGLQTHVSPNQLRAALRAICETHSMLRARFFWDAEEQAWLQRISEGTEGFFQLNCHSELSPGSELIKVIEETQQAVNIQCGPLLSVSLCNMVERADCPPQILFLTCHHLVIDLVSWRIILGDLESLLKSPNYHLPPQSTAFTAWNGLLRGMESPPKALDKPSTSCYSYWGLDDSFSTYADHILLSFTLNKTAAEAVLGACNQAYNTEPVELMLAALIHSFSTTFHDRRAPVFFHESHGRHSLRPDVDLSRTVGWFTTMFPVAITLPEHPCVLETIRRVKDSLRNIQEGTKLSVGPIPMEILFNYGGRYQHLSRSDALFRSYQLPGVDLDLMDVDQRMQRFALIEISVFDLDNRLNFGFRVDHRISRMRQIQEWVAACERTLVHMPDTMAIQPQPTLTDYPLLRTYRELDYVLRRGFEDAKIDNFGSVEDVYPCTPLQEQMLNANQHDSRLYIVRSIWEVTLQDGVPFDPVRFEAAWVEVVRRHDVLRTRFVAGSDSGHYQVVLREPTIDVNIWRNERSASTTILLQRPSLLMDPSKCPHRWDLSVAKNGHVSAQLQISHAIIDGLSVATLHHELSCFYKGMPLLPEPTQFKTFSKYLQTRPAAEDVQYWSGYLSSANPCYVGAPSLLPELLAARQRFRVQGVSVIHPHQIHAVCSRNGITPSIVFQTAWAMTLRNLSASDDVCFGYVIASRNTTAEGDQDAIGPFINFLSCREVVSEDRSSQEVMESLQASFLHSQTHQHSSLDRVHQDIAAKKRLFNTVVNFQGSTMIERDTTAALRFRQTFAEDPMEVRYSVSTLDSTDMLTGNCSGTCCCVL